MQSNQNPLVSVLMPYRDAETTLPDALESILADAAISKIDLEVVAINDHSTDAGPEFIARRAALDLRIRSLHTQERGIAHALSAGIAACRGVFVARMDADDISLPERLAEQVRLLQSNARLGAVGTQVELFGPMGTGEGMQRYVAWQNALITPEDHARAIFVESPLCHPSVMLKKSALLEIGGFRQGLFPEDYDCWLRLHTQGFLLAKVPRVLFRWRQHQKNATFRDPRYALERFTETRALYLAPWLSAQGRPIAVWGAGQTGKRLARALERHGVRASIFIDIDPNKIGSTARSAPIVDASFLERSNHTIVVAVGARGARDLVRAYLADHGFIEGRDFICAA